MSISMANTPCARADAPEGRRPPLGTTPNDILLNTPNLPFSRDLDKFKKIRDKRIERYILRWNAKNRFMEEGRKQGLQYPHDFHRTAKCGSVLISPCVGVNHGIEHDKAFYTGLLMCGRVWTCPVCSAKIQERRRLEIAQGMTWAYSIGLKCIMVTFTFPHTFFDNLPDLLTKQAEAFKLLRTGVMWQDHKEKIGFIGLIRSLELTIGVNGWHPHTHELWFVDPSCNIEDLHKVVLNRWESACIKTGLLQPGKTRAFRKRAVDIIDNATNSDYFQKDDKSKSWGIDHEIAKSSSKDSSLGCHPFELLSVCTILLPIDHKRRSEMFIDYAMAMRGKKQLTWSRGLKKLVGILDKTDEEICEEPDEISIILGQITPQRWKLVLQEKDEAEILYRAETGGWDKVEEWFVQREGKK